MIRSPASNLYERARSRKRFCAPARPASGNAAQGIGSSGPCDFSNWVFGGLDCVLMDMDPPARDGRPGSDGYSCFTLEGSGVGSESCRSILIASVSSRAAASLNSSMALERSCGTPRPAKYMRPSAVCPAR